MVELGHGWFFEAEDNYYTMFQQCGYDKNGKVMKYKQKYYSGLDGVINSYYREIVRERIKDECRVISDIKRIVEECKSEVEDMVINKYPNEIAIIKQRSA